MKFFWSACLCAFFLVGCFSGSDDLGITEEPAIRVRAKILKAEEVDQQINVIGKTKSSRQVNIRAETDGRVVLIGAEKGSLVQSGDVIVELDVRDKIAQLQKDEANLQQRTLEYGAAVELHKKKLESDAGLAAADASMKLALAEKEATLLDIEHTRVRVPFLSFLDDRFVEEGDYLSAGDSIASVVEMNPLHVVGYVTNQHIASIRTGLEGYAETKTGDVFYGTITYVAHEADLTTRTYRIELTIDNSGFQIPAGLNVDLVIPYKKVKAHGVKMSSLALNEQGDIGLKLVDEDGRVVFYPAEIAQVKDDLIWVTGLPEEARIITLGQGFVRVGDKVRVRWEN